MTNNSNIAYTEEQLVAEIRTLTVSRLQAWVGEGYLRPQQSERGVFFDELDRARVELMSTLCDDFDVREDALSIFLVYLDQLYSVRRDFARLLRAVDQQPDAVRHAIRKACDPEA
ncbi:MAG: hypothetical protein ACWA5T_11095 [Parvularcula sp.]